VAGLAYPLASSRQRYFGGTSNHWGGWVKPLDPIDFTRSPSAPLPSWPLPPDALNSHYSRAAAWCEVGSEDYTTGSLADPDSQLLFHGQEDFTTRLFRFSPPTRFGTRYREAVADHALVHCITDAGLIHLAVTGDGVRQARAASPDGATLDIAAERFVLAMGGIENARFLLHHNASTGASYGNASGLLGACFMDHFGFHPGYLQARTGLKYHRFRQPPENLPMMPVMTATEALQTRLDLPSICMMATPDAPSPTLPGAYFDNPGFTGAGPVPSGRYRLQMLCEPTAHAASRITLSPNKDAFGIARVVLDWRVLERDFAGIEQFLRRFAVTVGREGLGRIERPHYFTGERRQHLRSVMHHMGTTRMAEEERFGVVDPDCRVFGSRNLYLAGSSVFPRAGYANPTLTLIALADRLARHLHAGRG